ncbi:hypothetical protein ACKKBF_B03065 [Auxenochlorella protothecoides x Auxenochlorella symbiontica]
MPLYLGLDVGTSGTKALLYDPDKKQVLGRGSVAYGVQSSRAGEAEQDPAIWIEAVCTASRQALQGLPADQVRGIGVSGQQHGMVVLDKDNVVLRPAKLWCDVTSAEEAEELSRVYGTTLVPSFTATKLLWLKRHEPDVFAQVATVLLPHNYINFWLTGEAVMEASDASGTGFLSENPRLWDWERVKAVDPRLCDCLPPLRSANEPAGRLQPDAAERLGLPAGIVVGPGGGDNAMAALGVGAVEEGTLVLSLGTSGTLFGPSMGLIEDPTGIICPFADATGAWLPLLCTINCAGATGTWAEPRGDHGAGVQGAARLRRRYLPPFPGRRADAQLAPRQRCPARSARRQQQARPGLPRRAGGRHLPAGCREGAAACAWPRPRRAPSGGGRGAQPSLASHRGRRLPAAAPFSSGARGGCPRRRPAGRCHRSWPEGGQVRVEPRDRTGGGRHAAGPRGG